MLAVRQSVNGEHDKLAWSTGIEIDQSTMIGRHNAGTPFSNLAFLLSEFLQPVLSLPQNNGPGEQAGRSQSNH